MNFQSLNKLVINLPERTDRLTQFKEQLVYLPCSNLQIVTGVKHNIPYKGIAQAHLNCVMLAKQNGWDSVLIMEDDIKFQGKEQTYDHLLNCLADIPPDWNILLGGIYGNFGRKQMMPVNKHWSKVDEFCGLHFYIVNSNCYYRILEYNSDTHIDRWMNEGGNKLKCYVTTKFIATQFNGFSDNTKAKTDYTPYLAKFQLL